MTYLQRQLHFKVLGLRLQHMNVLETQVGPLQGEARLEGLMWGQQTRLHQLPLLVSALLDRLFWHGFPSFQV